MILPFIGGGKAIDIGATYGTRIEYCNFWSQSVASVDIQFGLNTVIEQCHANGAKHDNFVLRTGEDWGGTRMNSQSNHSIVSACRVYARKGANSAFKGAWVPAVWCCSDNISEGSKEIAFSVFYDFQGSAAAKTFTVENFHLEHAPQKGWYLHSV